MEAATPLPLQYPPRLRLGHYPTPVQPLPRLGSHLGIDLYVKRDDETGLATGGNKVRKLEFLVADAKARGFDHLVTLGGVQSNHCRQTAAAAARLGLKCSLVLRGSPPAAKLGNLLLDELLGAQVHWSHERTRDEVAADLVRQLEAAGHRPYMIPLGGSSALGVLGYAVALEELAAQIHSGQLPMPDLVVVASSSGGTQAGLLLGLTVTRLPVRLLGISIDAPAASFRSKVIALAREAGQLAGLAVSEEEVNSRMEVDDHFLGGGYAVVGDLERDAIRLAARQEGLLLDPVYTARAFGGLCALLGQPSWRSELLAAAARDATSPGRRPRVLFWHTGGVAALSAFSSVL